MNCKRIENLVTPYLLGDLDAEAARQVKAHLEQCVRCRALAYDIKPTLDLLRDALATSSRAVEHLSPAHRVQVMAGQEALPVPSRRDRVIEWITQRHPVLAAAASLVLLTGLGLVLVSGLLHFGRPSRMGFNAMGQAVSGEPRDSARMVQRSAREEKTAERREERHRKKISDRSGGEEARRFFVVKPPDAGAAEELQRQAPAPDTPMFRFGMLDHYLPRRGEPPTKMEEPKPNTSHQAAETAPPEASVSPQPVTIADLPPPVTDLAEDGRQSARGRELEGAVPPAPIIADKSSGQPDGEVAMVKSPVILKGILAAREEAERAEASAAPASESQAPKAVAKRGYSAAGADRAAGPVDKLEAPRDEVAGVALGMFGEAAPGGEGTEGKKLAWGDDAKAKGTAGAGKDESAKLIEGAAPSAPAMARRARLVRPTGESVRHGGEGPLSSRTEPAPPEPDALALQTELARKEHIAPPPPPPEASSYESGDGHFIEMGAGVAAAKAAAPTPPPEDADRNSTLARLRQTVIPELDFNQASVGEVVKAIEQATAAESPDGKGAKFRILSPALEKAMANREEDGRAGEKGAEAQLPSITLSAKEINAEEALKIVTQVAGLKYRVEGDQILLLSTDAPMSDIMLRLYDAPPSFVERVKALRPNGQTTQESQPSTQLADSDWSEFFGEMGVTLAAGSSVSYDPESRRLVVRSTEDGIAGFQQLYDVLSRTPGEPAATPPPTESDIDRNALIKRLESVTIPEVDFRQANLGDVVTFLNESARQQKPTDQGPVPDIQIDPKYADRLSKPGESQVAAESSGTVPITFSAYSISLLEALRIVTSVTGLKYRIEGDKVLIRPTDAAESFVRQFDVSPKVASMVAEFKVDRVPQADLKQFYSDLGVSWPQGSSVRYLPAVRKLVVANTAENLVAFETVLTKLSAEAEETKKEDETGPRFKAVGVNPFYPAAERPLSTFAIDVDTASYTLSRNLMLKGLLPPAEAVRTEEFVNFFDYVYPPPAQETFAVYAAGAPSRFGHGLHLLKIGIKGRRLGREEQRRSALTFLVDTSGSMDKPDRIDLVKRALRLLVNNIEPEDRVAVVQYDSHARLVLEHTPAGEKQKILDALDALQCSGSTNLEEGMERAYAAAAAGFVPGGENRVLVLSDGAANLGSVAAEEILAKVERFRKQGITCSIFGFGVGTYNDEMLEALADKGNGAYGFIDSEDEARRLFVDDLGATLNTIASDVKIQVEFNPRRVTRYRQLGYENRQLKDEDFRNDAVDAGEVGSGQSVTALYELELAAGPGQALESAEPWPGGAPDAVAVVRVRYRRTADGKIEEIQRPVRAADFAARFEEAEARFRLAACVAEFAEILRASPHAAGSEPRDVAEALRPVALEMDLDPRVAELLRMVEGAGGMSRAE